MQHQHRQCRDYGATTEDPLLACNVMNSLLLSTRARNCISCGLFSFPEVVIEIIGQIHANYLVAFFNVLLQNDQIIRYLPQSRSIRRHLLGSTQDTTEFLLFCIAASVERAQYFLVSRYGLECSDYIRDTATVTFVRIQFR